MRTDDTVKDLQNMFRYTFRFTNELVILDEAIIVAADKTNGLQVR
jgi:hypothetical protein